MSLSLIATPAPAVEPGSHLESASYHIYLGVVPASQIKENPALVDGDKTLHKGNNAGDTSQHVLVAVFYKPNNERVASATVITRVRLKKLLNQTNVEKPLEKMLTSGLITYGNYFQMPTQGDYEITVRIYDTNKDEAETVTFLYKKL